MSTETLKDQIKRLAQSEDTPPDVKAELEILLPMIDVIDGKEYSNVMSALATLVARVVTDFAEGDTTLLLLTMVGFNGDLSEKLHAMHVLDGAGKTRQ